MGKKKSVLLRTVVACLSLSLIGGCVPYGEPGSPTKPPKGSEVITFPTAPPPVQEQPEPEPEPEPTAPPIVFAAPPTSLAMATADTFVNQMWSFGGCTSTPSSAISDAIYAHGSAAFSGMSVGTGPEWGPEEKLCATYTGPTTVSWQVETETPMTLAGAYTVVRAVEGQAPVLLAQKSRLILTPNGSTWEVAGVDKIPGRLFDSAITTPVDLGASAPARAATAVASMLSDSRTDGDNADETKFSDRGRRPEPIFPGDVSFSPTGNVAVERTLDGQFIVAVELNYVFPGVGSGSSTATWQVKVVQSGDEWLTEEIALISVV